MRCVHAPVYAHSKQEDVLGKANTCTHLLCDTVRLEEIAVAGCILAPAVGPG